MTVKKYKILRDIMDYSYDELMRFVWTMHRCETDENPHIFGKGVRCCLIALGYPAEWVNGDFYDILSEMLYKNSDN